MEYIRIPETISYKDLKAKQSLSPHSYKTISLANSNTKTIEGLLISNPMKGQEVGSSVYITRSPFYFIRNKALQPSSYLPNLADPECSVPILPGAFVDLGLKQGDILISKDANVGESAYLNEDLPHHMISGGLVRLRFPQDVKYYIFAFMKNDFFRDQIELAPRAATITHAKNLWLNALIPFPCQQDSNDVIEFVSLLMRALIRKEAEIMRKYDSAIDLINRELMENQQSKDFTYALPSAMEIRETLRLDAGMFCEDYKMKQFHIRNYVKGSQTIFDFGFRLKRGQNMNI